MLNARGRLVLSCGCVAAALAGCVVVPVASDGSPVYPLPAGVYPVVPVPTVTPDLQPLPGRSARAVPPSPLPQSPPPTANLAVAPTGPSAPASLQARLYPSNDVATEVGMLAGTVTNMMTGKGFFQLNYKGEILSGEATRVPGDERRGLANAYGQHGTFMTCDYRMTTPYLGTGTCSLSNGAQYQVHIGG